MKDKKSKKYSKTIKNNKLKISKSTKIVRNTSRLSKLQRKYCSCLIAVRSKKLSPYPICFKSLAKSKNLHKTKKKRSKFYNILKPHSSNCILNYDYDNLSLRDIQLLAKEKHIPISYTRNNTKRFYKKSTLTQKLINNYLEKSKKTKSK